MLYSWLLVNVVPQGAMMASEGPASLLFFKQILHPASGCREVLAAEQAVAFHSEAVTAQLQHLPPGPGTKVLLTAVVFAHSLSSAQGPLCSSQKEVPCYPAQCSSSWWAFCGFSMGNVFFWLPITAVCWCSVAGRLVLSQMQLSAVERCVRMLPREASTSLYWINKVFCMGLKALHTHRKSQRNPIRYDPSSLSALLKIQCKILNVWLHMSSEGHVSIVSWEILKIK